MVDPETEVSINVSENEVVSAVDLVVPLMYQGETCEVITDPDFAYGETGRRPISLLQTREQLVVNPQARSDFLPRAFLRVPPCTSKSGWWSSSPLPIFRR